MFDLRYIDDVVTLKLDKEKCNGCRLCTYVCPHEVFSIKDKRAEITDFNACIECGACEQNCETGAISVRAGVGCAAGIINGVLKGTAPSCGCSGEEGTGSSACC